MITTSPSGASHCSVSLSAGWTFKQGGLTSTSEELTANDLPTEIYRDLLKHKRISDPFLDLHELSVQWISDATWTYRTTFDAPPSYKQPNVFSVLQFGGIDTFAFIYLNGELVLTTDNMFLEHRLNVTGRLKACDNTLEVVFESARKRGLSLVEEHEEHRFIVHQTEISRGPVRKAQYHWGWDWGPILLTCGIWKPILIETYTGRVFNVWVHYELAADLKSAEVRLRADTEGKVAAISFTITNEKAESIVASTTVVIRNDVKSRNVEALVKVKDIDLWWPRTYGTQTLYCVQAVAHSQTEPELSIPIHSVSTRFDFRKVELIQEPDSHGKSFYFRINNVDIFCGGSCWIPADSFLTRITPEKYRSWVHFAAAGNQTMLRVWGGGIYESEVFYDTADELGVLVWQDFAFACANYPAYAVYLNSVKGEARQNVQRLRNHPSLVIWAGNNEDYQIVERYGLKYDVEDKDPQSWLKTNFPARYIYEHLLPSIMAEESPNTPYHSSSPFGDGTSSVLKVDPTIGDVHQWNIWHGTMQPYQQLPDLGGRFVSEFGMEAYPHVSTLKQCITKDEDRYPGSMAMDFRNKAVGHERRLVSYLAENFRIQYNLEGFSHLTQVMQVDALSWAYKAWRRQWTAPGNRKCGGVLVWQLNDCWPTVSWAVVDYHLTPKPSYYAIKRVMQTVAVCVQREFRNWTARPAGNNWQRDTGHIDMQKLWRNSKFDVWIANSSQESIQGHVTIRCFSVGNGKELPGTISRKVMVAPNGTTEILQDHIFEPDELQGENSHPDICQLDPFVVHAALDINGQSVASDVSWPDPIKYLPWNDRGVEVRGSDDGTVIFITALKPVKGFVFHEQPGTRLNDNGFDIMPGEKKEVYVQGRQVNELKWNYVGM